MDGTVIQVLKPFLEVGVVGSVAVLFIFLWWKSLKRNQDLQHEIVQLQKDHAVDLKDLNAYYDAKWTKIIDKYNALGMETEKLIATLLGKVKSDG